MSYHRMELYKRGTVVLTDNECNHLIGIVAETEGRCSKRIFLYPHTPIENLGVCFKGVRPSLGTIVLAACHMPTNMFSELSRVSLIPRAQDRCNANHRCAIDEPGKVKCHAR